MQHDIAYYKKIQNAYGSTSAKETSLREIQMSIERSFETTVNWERVQIGTRLQDLQITRTADMKIKDISALPNEVLRLGERILWRNAYWMITKLNADNQIVCIGKMTQCNVALKWQLEDGSIYTEYGVAEDATKYGTGVKDSQYIQIGEFSLKVKVPINELTLKIRRDKRFLIGQYGDGYRPNAFVVTRLNQVTNTYEDEKVERDENGKVIYQGYLEITLGEDQYREESDRGDLGVADYVELTPDAEVGVDDTNEDGVVTETEVPDESKLEESGWF